MKNICIIQTNRSGDIIHTTQAIENGLNDNRYTLICRKTMFSIIGDIVSKFYYQIIYIEDLFSEQKFLHDPHQGSISFITAINSIFKNKFDQTVNLSFSKSSSYLASLIPSHHILGPFRDHFNKIIIQDNWSRYLFSTVIDNIYNSFHIIDLFKKILSLHDRPIKYSPSINSIKSIVIHPFSSDQKKSWPIQHWKNLCIAINKNFPKIKIIIIGNTSEVTSLEMADKTIFETYSNKEIIKQIKYTDLFIGNDSLGGAIAAFFKISTITLSLGPARAEETIPYGNQNIFITSNIECYPCNTMHHCEHKKCHSLISVDSVYQIVENIILNKTSQNLSIEIYDNDEATVGISYFCEQNTLSIKRNNYHHESIHNVIKKIYNVIFNFLLNDSEENIKIPKCSLESISMLTNTYNNLKKVSELFAHGKQFAINFHNGKISLQDFIERMNEIDLYSLALKNYDKFLAPLINYYYTERQMAAGENPLTISIVIKFSFEEAIAVILTFQELLNKIINNQPSNNRQ